MIIFVVACSHFSGSWSSASELWKHSWSPFNDHDIFDFEVEVWAWGDGSASFLQSATIAKYSCIIQLAIKRPVLTGSESEIVNSIVWRLPLTLTKAVPKPDTPERAYKIYLSRSTIGWVAGDHPTTVDRFETAAITKRNPLGVTEATCFQGCLMLTLAGVSTQSLGNTYVYSLISVLGRLLRSAKDSIYYNWCS